MARRRISPSTRVTRLIAGLSPTAGAAGPGLAPRPGGRWPCRAPPPARAAFWAPHPRLAPEQARRAAGAAPAGRGLRPGGCGRRRWGPTRAGGGGEAARAKSRPLGRSARRSQRLGHRRTRSEVREVPERRETTGRWARGGDSGTSTRSPGPCDLCARLGPLGGPARLVVLLPGLGQVLLDLKLWFLPRLRWILRRERTEPLDGRREQKVILDGTAGISPGTSFPLYASSGAKLGLGKKLRKFV